MYNEFKKLAKHGSIYTVGIILGRIVAFVMIPIYTNYLTPDDYGLIQMLSLTIDIVSMLFGLGMAAAAVRFYHNAQDEQSKKRVFSSAVVGSLTLLGGITALCLILAAQFSQLIFSNSEQTGNFRIMFLTMFFSGGLELPFIFLRVRLESGKFVLYNLAKLIVSLGLNIYFLVYLKMGVEGVLYSGLISAALFAFVLVMRTFRQTGFSFNLPEYKTMLAFGAPLIVSDFSAFAMTYGDRYFLNYYSDLKSVGIYSMAYTIGMFLSLVVNRPFISIWTTEMYRLGKQENGKAIFAKTLIYYLIVALTVSLGLSVLTRDVMRVMANESYWDAYLYVPFISFSYVLAGVIYVAGAGALLAGKSKYKAYSTSIATATNIVCNFALIPPLGAFGAAIATIIAYAVRMTVDVYFSQKLFKVPYDLPKVVVLGVLYVLLLIPAMYVKIDSIVLSVIFNIGVILLFPIMVYFLGVLSAQEKAWVNRLIRNPATAVKELRQG